MSFVGDGFGFEFGCGDSSGETVGDTETNIVILVGEGVAGFADEDNLCNIGGFQNTVELGEVSVVGLVATADDED